MNQTLKFVSEKQIFTYIYISLANFKCLSLAGILIYIVDIYWTIAMLITLVIGNWLIFLKKKKMKFILIFMDSVLIYAKNLWCVPRVCVD